MLVVTSRDPGAPPVEYIRHSGGIFKDMLIHDFDIFRWMLDDEADTLHATGSCLSDPAIAEAGDIDSTAVTIRTKRGRLCQINTARRAAYGYDQRFELLGSAGMLQAGNVRPTEVTAYSKTAVSSDVPEAFFLERYRAAYALEIAHFFDAVTEGKPVRTTVADGLKALELAEAATRSWREGRDRQTRGGRMKARRCGLGSSAWGGWAAARGKPGVARAGRVAGGRLQSGCGRARVGARTCPNSRFTATTRTCSPTRAIDAVWLVTPTSLHAEQIIAALRAGKHVFCEKPLSLDLDECDRVIEESARYPQLQVMIGFVRRFDPSYRDAFDKIGRARSAGRSWCARKPATRTIPMAFSCGSRRPRAAFSSIAASTTSTLRAGCSAIRAPKRVFASGTIAIHEGLRECGDIDNGVGHLRVRGRPARGVLRVADAWPTVNDTQTEVIGTSGALSVGHNPRVNRVEIADATGCATNACRPSSNVSRRRSCTKRVRSSRRCGAGRRPASRSRCDAREATRIGIALRQAFESGQPVKLQALR